MILRLIKWLSPAERFDPQLLKVTEIYLWGLLIVFLLGFIFILAPVFKRRVQLALSGLGIRRILRKTGSDLSRARQDLNEKLFKRVKWAKKEFQTFRFAWEEARPRGEDKAILPIRLREFLPPEIVLDGARNRRMAEALPGFFVALGIWGTFLGLVLGLKELEFDKLEQLQNGVGHLISGLSVAFLTSLGGIALSIIFSLLYRFFINGLEQSFFAIDTLLSQVYLFESSERYARRHYELQADVKQGLQTLATDVAVQIGNNIGPKLGEALENHLVPVMKEMQGWIRNHIEETKTQQGKLLNGFNENLIRLSKVITEHFEYSQQRQSEAMEAVLQHYSASLTDTFKAQFESMGRVIEDTTQAQMEIKNQLSNFSNQMQAQFQAQTELIEKTTRAGEILGESLERLESISLKLKASADEITSAAQLLEQSAHSAKEGQDILRETMHLQIEKMTQTRKELESTWQSVTEGAREAVDHIRQTIKELSEGIGENMVKALDTFDGKVAEVVERFSGTLYDAGQTIGEMPAIISRLETSLNAISEGTTAQKMILSELKETTQNMVAANIQKAFDAAKTLADFTNQIAAIAGEMNRFFDNFLQKLNQNTELFDQRNRQTVGDLTRLTEGLVAGIEKSTSLLGENGPVGRALLTLEEIRGNGINPQKSEEILAGVLSEPFDTLGHRIDELKDALIKIVGNGSTVANQALLERVTAIDQQIGRLSSELNENIYPHLDQVSKGVNRMSNSFESLKSSHKESPNGNEGRRTLFGFKLGK